MTDRTGIIIVDHGSRNSEANCLIREVVDRFACRFAAKYRIVEPAHMELAEPSIRKAFDRCVARGATEVLVLPLFLGPGKHWREDIPGLAAFAAHAYPGVAWAVAPPLGADDLLLDLLDKRAGECAMSPAVPLPV
jgi:sirohydrochlorin ferrochelatase